MVNTGRYNSAPAKYCRHIWSRDLRTVYTLHIDSELDSIVAKWWLISFSGFYIFYTPR
jgi:hypothetical protein